MRKSKALFIVLLMAVAAMSGAQSYRSKDGSIEIKGWESWRVTGPAGKRTFVAKSTEGGKVHATWVDRSKGQTERVTVEAAQIEGMIDETGIATITNAKMTGGIQAVVTRPSANASSNQKQTATLTGREANYIAAENRVDLTGGVKIVNSDPGTSETTTTTGSTAKVILSEASSRQRAVVNANVQGPVETLIRRPSANVAASQPQTARLTSRSAIYNASENQIDLTGDVNIVSEDPGASQTFRADGKSARVGLAGTGVRGQVIQTASLDGPINMKMNGIREDSVEGTKKKLPFVVNGAANRMTFSDAERRINLEGDVHIDSDHPSIGG
ncbi:MAG TPA: LPS export ABC transporter periplasmic protein LptC, partial [Fimbriimonadaceae bacterium]|nr:LPS export ABC transporter periplasmic protein LptC [Fimbriimonadaceae bacterium]